MLVDGAPSNEIDALDRGLLYGDGLFETILFIDGQAPLWERHIARLQHGCERLAFSCPDEITLLRDCAHVTTRVPRAVVRLTLTRGSGARGYAPPEDPRVRRIVAAFVAPEIPQDWYTHGIRVRFCATHLAAQPLLAGMKHLNRLEQVLARAEWNDADIAEGLMFDSHDRPLCATASNLFAVVDGELITPALDECGVAGTARAEVLARHPHCRIAPIDRGMLERADEVFLTSSVRGIVPIRATPDRDYPVGPRASALQDTWRSMGLLEPLQ
jgi:4-amino-4-deoxychorismate lyase